MGPRAYRTRLRVLGPIAALIPAALMGLVALLMLRGNTSLARGVGGFALAIFAAPGLLAAGVPLSTGASTYFVAIVASAALWLLIGVLASRRATRSPVATWRDFWREWAWPAAGVWIGVAAALGVADLLLGRTLF